MLFKVLFLVHLALGVEAVEIAKLRRLLVDSKFVGLVS